MCRGILGFQIEAGTKLIAEQLGPYIASEGNIGSHSQCPVPAVAAVPVPETSSAVPPVVKKSSAADNWKLGVKKALLQWVRNGIDRYVSIPHFIPYFMLGCDPLVVYALFIPANKTIPCKIMHVLQSLKTFN